MFSFAQFEQQILQNVDRVSPALADTITSYVNEYLKSNRKNLKDVIYILIDPHYLGVGAVGVGEAVLFKKIGDQYTITSDLADIKKCYQVVYGRPYTANINYLKNSNATSYKNLDLISRGYGTQKPIHPKIVESPQGLADKKFKEKTQQYQPKSCYDYFIFNDQIFADKKQYLETMANQILSSSVWATQMTPDNAYKTLLAYPKKEDRTMLILAARCKKFLFNKLQNPAGGLLYSKDAQRNTRNPLFWDAQSKTYGPNQNKAQLFHKFLFDLHSALESRYRK